MRDETSFSPSPRAASRPPQQPEASPQHQPRRGPAPVDEAPPAEDRASSDALTIEMSGLEARPPTAPESWLRVGSAPPLGFTAATTSHPTSQVGSERDSTPDTARAQTHTHTHSAFAFAMYPCVVRPGARGSGGAGAQDACVPTGQTQNNSLSLPTGSNLPLRLSGPTGSTTSGTSKRQTNGLLHSAPVGGARAA